MDEQEKYRQAKQRVAEIKGFYLHLVVFVIINAALVGINLVTDRSRLWFYWPLIGWGVGLLAHAFSTFGISGFLGTEWEERKIREILETQDKRDA